MNKSITLKSFAKLNLYLEITGKRDDGYHLLKSAMQSISLFDTLKFDLCDGDGIEILCNKSGVPTDEKNLIWKAIDAFYDKTGLEKSKIVCTLEKNIPSMAGMAGGSSNAAATLVAMNELYFRPLSVFELCEIGAKLGADIPFCINGGTVLCEGIGDKMTSINPVSDCCFLVVKPDVSVSTPEAYKRFDNMEIEQKPNFSCFMQGIEYKDIDLVSDSIYNSLEIACDLKEVNEIKQKMTEFGALNSMMTGSGSAVFGIFKSKEMAEKALTSFENYSFSGVYEPINKGVEIINNGF